MASCEYLREMVGNMTRKHAYFFGNLATEVEVFAYPRVGSHYFVYCLSGLFDLVAFKNEHLNNLEAIARQDELNDAVLYQLTLREDGVPFQPLVVDAVSTGVHGLPRLGEKPAIILMRDPMATLYSLYLVSRARWGQTDGIWPWLGHAHAHYTAFYTRAFELIERAPSQVLLVKYEALKAGPETLEHVVNFVGHRPKLRPSFVHDIMRFDNFAKQGTRTFYRAGQNEAWLNDATFCEAVQALTDTSAMTWGYPSLAEYKARAEQVLPQYAAVR